MDATNTDEVKCKSADSTILESALETLFPHDNLLHEAVRYSLFSGGKRIRPRLVLATAETYGIPTEHALIPACAIELIHTYSLIHDDLPCMDNDDMRRGKPTLHKAYPEWHALLTGDFLLTYAFELLSDAPYLSSDQKIALIRTLSYRAGEHGMIGGQHLEFTLKGKNTFRQEIHFKKTACLMIAALEFGGIIAACPDLDKLRDIGKDLGLAFQLIDDVIDGESSEADQSLARAHYNSAVQNIRSLSMPAPLLEELATALVFRTH